jgi:ABC-type multidrug transport system ATPase subunit
MLARLKSEGITIIVSTPYMDEALRCDRIALIQSGSILGIDTTDNVRRSYSQKLYAVTHPNKYKLLLALRSLPGRSVPLPRAISSEPFGDSVHITLPEGTTPEELLAALAASGLPGAAITEIVPGIEDVFLELMQNKQ